MTRDLIVSSNPRETRVALLEDGVVAEIFMERESQRGIVGSIYKGRVTRVLPGMQSAFLDLGLERDAFLHAADVFEQLPENELSPEEVQAARSAPIEERLHEGEELVVWAYGALVRQALEAADDLAVRGVRVGVVDARFAKPLDEELLGVHLRRYRHVLKVFLLDESLRIRNVYSAGLLDARLLLNDVETVLAE